MDNEQLAYTAGIIDGEGYVGIYMTNYVKRYPQPTVKVGNTNEAMIDYLLVHYGGTKVFRKGFRERDKPSWHWQLNKWTDIVTFLSAIRPWLRIKAAQADLVLQICQNPTPNRTRGMTNQEKERREALYQAAAILNRRGRIPRAECEREGE